MQKSNLNCEWFTAKLDVEFKTNKLSDSFKMHVRLRKDSAIWISATYYSVEAARFLITQDTVKFMDRKANQYFIGDINYINKKFDVELDFESLQAILLGNGFYIEDDERLKSYPKDDMYYLSSVGRRKLKKEDKQSERDDKHLEKEQEKLEKKGEVVHGELEDTEEKRRERERREKNHIAYTVGLYPENFKVATLSIYDLMLNKSLFVNVKKYQKVDEMLVPETIKLVINADENITTSIDYLKVSINKPTTFTFAIPDKYERIN